MSRIAGFAHSQETKDRMAAAARLVWQRPERRTLIPVGPRSHRWKGGRRTNRDGYVMIRVGHHYIFEHRLVMEKMLGRPMLASEQVHHRNGVKDDNTPGNLELRTGPHGRGATVHCPTCTCEAE